MTGSEIAVLYIVTCGPSMKFVKWMTTWRLEAFTVECQHNKPATVWTWDGNNMSRLRRLAERGKAG